MMPSDIGCEMERESDYPYTAMDGKCKFNRSKVVTKVSKFVKVPKKREDQLKLSVAQVGPVSVAIDAASSGFMLYKKGIYQDNTCSEDYLDHAVLVVGYDADKTRQKYWIVKNRARTGDKGDTFGWPETRETCAESLQWPAILSSE
ncbi:Cathepsin L [Echinococcus granulosus]|nr:Cathepsin L [Echinococcus granulosus]